MRMDQEGRDVTDLPGLWEEHDTLRDVMDPQPPERVQRLILQNDGKFYEATRGDMPLTGDFSIRAPSEDVRPERVCGVWVWVKGK